VSAADRKELHLPDVPAVIFERNFIKTAVCELRFPTLLEYETEPPRKLQKELRKDYPLYDEVQAVSVGPDTVGRERRYLFKSRDGKWIASFKSFAIALETSHYTEFDDFAERLNRLLAKSQALIDSDFFTRVGLRYIDEIMIEDNEISGWINDHLIAPLAQGTYGTVERFIQEVRGYASTGPYTFKHGIVGRNASDRQVYTLDFDFYQENVKFDDVLALVSEFNKMSFRFFCWAIGPKARGRLGQESPRKAR
jgi:uncharacterized protein (TIGR04255 family)